MPPPRRTVFKVLSIAVVVIHVGIALVAIYVYKESVGKFEVRRLSLPTRIYADYTPLQTGIILSPDDIEEKLDRLGYRQVDSVAQAGDYTTKRGDLQIFTRQFSHPTGTYDSQPIRLAFKGAQIESISRSRSGLLPSTTFWLCCSSSGREFIGSCTMSSTRPKLSSFSRWRSRTSSDQ